MWTKSNLSVNLPKNETKSRYQMNRVNLVQELLFPKEYNIAKDEYARHVRTQSMVFGFFTVLLTYSICVISVSYGNMVMQDAIYWIGISFASQIIFIA